MSSRLSAAVLALTGFVLIVGAPESISSYRVDDVLVGLGIVYLLAGIGGGIVSFLDREPPSFRMGIGIAVVSVLIVIASWIWYLGHPAVGRFTPTEPEWWVALVSVQPGVTIPLVAAFIFPLVLAPSSRERRIAIGLLSIPLIVGFLRFAMSPSAGFGFGFNITLVGLLVIGGLVTGIPLYVYAKVLETDDDATRVILSHLDFGQTP